MSDVVTDSSPRWRHPPRPGALRWELMPRLRWWRTLAGGIPMRILRLRRQARSQCPTRDLMSYFALSSCTTSHPMRGNLRSPRWSGSSSQAAGCSWRSSTFLGPAHGAWLRTSSDLREWADRYRTWRSCLTRQAYAPPERASCRRGFGMPGACDKRPRLDYPADRASACSICERSIRRPATANPAPMSRPFQPLPWRSTVTSTSVPPCAPGVSL